MGAIDPTAEVARLTTTYQLGTPYAQFQASPEKHSRLHFTVTSCITYLIIGTFTLFTGIAAIASLFDGSSYQASRTLFGLAAILTIALLVFISGDSKTTIKMWTIYVCPQGLLQYETRKQIALAIHWEQIKEYFIETWEEAESIPESNFSRSWKCYKFTLKHVNDTTLKFKGTSDFGALQHIIEKEIVSVQLPAIIDAYNAGKTIAFGAIILNQAGVSNGQYTFPWNKILSIDFEGAFICVHGFEWNVSFRAPKASIPNACVMEALVKQLDRQGKTGIAAPVHMTTGEKMFSRKVHRLKRYNKKG